MSSVPDRTLVAIDSPGHAKHHVGFHDSLSGVLFAGDAVGVKLPDGGVLRPATPPPDFDLDLALTSLEKFAARRPTAIALAHYGLLEAPEELLAEAGETLREWAETAESAYRAGTDIAEALAARFDAVTRRRRPRPQGEARHPEWRPLQRRRLSPLAGRARNHALTWSDLEQRPLLDHHFGAKLLLADFEVVQRDPAVGQVFVQSGELLE